MNKQKSTLKDRLNEALILRCKKAADLTKDLNIPKSAISQYLSGKSQNMDTDRLQKIAAYLKVNEPWLLGYDVPMEISEENIQQSYNSVDTSIIDRLQIAFKQSGLTQAQLASATGITKSSISRYLQGEFEPKATAVVKLAAALNVSVEYLMGMESTEQIDLLTDEELTDRKAESREVFAANLRALMGKTGKSRKDVSESIGVSYFTFSDWCNGKKYPRIEKIEALAQYFDVSVSELVGDTNTNQQFAPNRNDKDDVLGIILRLHTDRDFLDVVEKMSMLNSDKLNALRNLLEAFGESCYE